MEEDKAPFMQRTWHHVEGAPNQRTWRAAMLADGKLLVEGLDDAGGIADLVTLERRGAFIVVKLQQPTTKLPSFMSWLQPVADLRERARMFGLPVPEDKILIHSSRVELMVELGYLPKHAIEQTPGNASGAAHFFGIECVWCKDLDIYAAVI